MLAATSGDRDYVAIRGRRLPLDGLLNSTLIDDAATVRRLHEEMAQAQPFPHIVIDDLFDPRLLTLISDEFPEDASGLNEVLAGGDRILRSLQNPVLGPATQLYFDLIHSGRFVAFLSQLTGIDNLIVDCSLRGGGLHSTKPDGRFKIHCDFNYHRDTRLRNRFVLLTYLNEGWKPEYGGDLEMWDAERMACVKTIAPIFGRTVLILHTDRSFHGHPEPLSPPPGRTRRSLASYYYTNEVGFFEEPIRGGSVHLDRLGAHPLEVSPWKRAFLSLTWRGRARMVLRELTPPLIWSATRGAVSAFRRSKRPAG